MNPSRRKTIKLPKRTQSTSISWGDVSQSNRAEQLGQKGWSGPTRLTSAPHLTRRFAFGVRRSAFGVRRSAFVLVLVLVLVRCCLQKRRVNPIRSAFPELHPRSGLKVLTRRFVLVLVLVVVVVLESGRAE